MKEIKAEEYFSIGFELGKRNYWTIFFNFLIYAVVCFCVAITVVGILILPAIFVGLIKFLLKKNYLKITKILIKLIIIKNDKIY